MNFAQSQTTRTKSEPLTPDVRSLKRKKAPPLSSSSEDDTPLKSSPAKAKSAAVPMPGAVKATAARANGKNSAKGKSAVVYSSDDDDVPVAKKKRVSNGKSKPPPKKRVKKEESDDDFGLESEDDKPITVKKSKPQAKRKAKQESDEDDEPLRKPAAKRAPAKKVKKEEEPSGSETPQPKKKGAKVKKEEGDEDTKKGKKKKKEEEEEEVFRWWEQQDANGDTSEKWQTLEHNGVYFPPPYEPLPSSVKMRYNGTCSPSRTRPLTHITPLGKPVDLPLASEEVAGFYAALIESDHAKDKTFNKNFFEDFVAILKKNPPVRRLS